MKDNTLTIKSPEGFWITTWKEGDPIESFSAYPIVYCPKDSDTSVFRFISDSEYQELSAKQLEYFQKLLLEQRTIQSV